MVRVFTNHFTVTYSVREDTNRGIEALAYSVYVSGTDVYVGGYEYDGTKNIAKIWKNGVSVPLQNSANAGFITSVFVK